MTTRYYFVDPAPCRSNLLQMEIRLVHILKEDIADCVLSEDAVQQYVKDLNAAQDNISRENPKLRRVEISTDLRRDYRYSSLCGWIIIGQYHCPLREVRRIQ